MITPGRHRPLVQDAWNESAVRVAIEEIAADAIAHFHPDTFWPAHPSDDGVGDGDPSFYKGAAGVIWALDYLQRIGATRVAEDFRPVLPKLMERTVIDHKASSPTDYEKHGSLLRGDMGAALLAMRLEPTSSLADLVYRRAEANNGLPIREAHVGYAGVDGCGSPHGQDDRGRAMARPLRSAGGAAVGRTGGHAARSTLDPGSLRRQRPLSRTRSRLRRQRHPVIARVGLVDGGAASARNRICAEVA